jgi:hypothetical protein
MQPREGEITAILSVWKRPHLEEQLEALARQTVRPSDIWIYQNEAHVEVPRTLREKYGAKLVQSHDRNFKYHLRFVLPLLADTEYVTVFDDDTIPGTRWLENCLRTSRQHGCLVTATGRIVETLSEDGFEAFHLGDGRPVPRDVEVDYGAHCQFFKAAWIRCMWVDRPLTWENGEDIHLAAACRVYAGVPCFIPHQPEDDLSLWADTKVEYGDDDVATWKKPRHLAERAEVIRHWVDKGWQLRAMT